MKRVLIISYYWPPAGLVSAFALMQIFRYEFRIMGISPDAMVWTRGEFTRFVKRYYQ